MKYYAAEKTRDQQMKDRPDYETPKQEDPPYDRDRHLPRAGVLSCGMFAVLIGSRRKPLALLQAPHRS